MSPSPPFGTLGEDEVIVLGTNTTMFGYMRPFSGGLQRTSSGWQQEAHVGIDLHDRVVELRRPREWRPCRVACAEPRGEWTWRQLRDGLVDVGWLPFNAVIFDVEHRPGRLFVGYWTKAGPNGPSQGPGTGREMLADVS